MSKFGDLSPGKKVAVILGVLILVNIIGFTSLFFLLGGPHLAQTISSIFTYKPGPDEDYSPEGRIKTNSKKIAANPRDAKAYEQRAQAYEGLDDYNSALKDMNSAISIKDDDASWYKDRADIHERLGHLDAAIDDYGRAIKLSPSDDSIYVDRAHCYSKLNKQKEAFADYAKALEVSNKKSWIYFNRARLYEALGDDKNAITDYNKAIETADKSEGDPQSVRNLVELHDRLGETEQAIKDCDRWVSMKPSSYDAYEMRGDLYEQAGQSEKAKADYEQAEKLLTEEIEEDRNSSVLDNRAEIRVKLGHVEGAKKDWLKAIERYKNKEVHFMGDLSEYDSIAELYDKIGDTASAKEWRQKHVDQLSEEIKKSPQVADKWHDRGVVYTDMNELDKALSDFTKALELSPDDGDYHHHRAVCYIKQKKYPQALAEAQRAVGYSAGTGSDFHETLAHALELTGRHEAAIIAANQALMRFKSDGRALYWRAQAEQNLGQTAESKRDFARAKRFGCTAPD